MFIRQFSAIAFRFDGNIRLAINQVVCFYSSQLVLLIGVAVRLKGLDLNLLIALDVLLEEGSVSRAAERLHLSQPAASAALGRLRDYFKDEILVLHGKQMIPTSYAESLRPEVKRILEKVDAVIAMSVEFDPLRSERVFRVMAADYINVVLLIPLAAKLATIAPNVRLDIQLPDDVVTADFERGDVDLTLVPEQFLSALHPSELLFVEPHVVVGWKDNPVFQRPFTIEDFYAASHVGVRIGPTRVPSFTESYLVAMERKRKMAAYVPNFSLMPWFLLGTMRLAVMQQRLAQAFEAIMPLQTRPLPFEIPTMRLMAQYHRARAADQGLRWLLAEVHAAANRMVEVDKITS
jgi:LysR family nod box-dependent transcriptional activator